MALNRIFFISILIFFTGQSQAQTLRELVATYKTKHATESAKIKDAVKQGKSVNEAEFSAEYKELLLKIYRGYEKSITNTDQINPVTNQQASFFKSALEKLEYKEDDVDQSSDRIKSHLSELESKKFGFKKRITFEFISWQSQATLKGPFENTGLLTTNLGICPGIGVNYENRFWAHSFDLCGLYGSGGVSAIQGLVEYQQTSVPAYGAKISLGSARVVASSGSELGIHGNLLYVKQNLTTPSSAGYSVEQDKPWSGTVTLYSRWRFQNFYFQTDFGRYIGRPATIWSFGSGILF